MPNNQTMTSLLNPLPLHKKSSQKKIKAKTKLIQHLPSEEIEPPPPPLVPKSHRILNCLPENVNLQAPVVNMPVKTPGKTGRKRSLRIFFWDSGTSIVSRKGARRS